jgi:hypothetical protein
MATTLHAIVAERIVLEKWRESRGREGDREKKIRGQKKRE